MRSKKLPNRDRRSMKLGRLQYLTPILQLVDPTGFFPAVKLLRRKSAALQKKEAKASDPLNMWEVARTSFKHWFTKIYQNTPVQPLRNIAATEIDAYMFTDSSLTGFGGVLVVGGFIYFYGRKWDTAAEHINVLEVEAVSRVTNEFADLLQNKTVHLFVDNTTAKHTLQRGSAKTWALANAVGTTLKSLKLAKVRSVTVSWIESKKMPADPLSRGKCDTISIGELALGLANSRLGGGRAIQM